MWDLAAISAAAHTGRIMEERERDRDRETREREGMGKEMIEVRFQLTYSARRGTSQQAASAASGVAGWSGDRREGCRVAGALID